MGDDPGRKVLLFDIETAGVQGLKADRGFVVCFGYKWLGDKKAKCISIAQYPGKNPHDDSRLLREIIKILNDAYGFVAHFGDKFDKPFVDSRLIQAGLSPIPNQKLTDTCLVARGKLKLSSNRLGNLANFLRVEQKKMEKHSGWPDWWMGALRGDKKSISKISAYCIQDVECLEACYLKMRHLIPNKFLPLNAAIGQSQWTCSGCAGHKYQHRGLYFSDKKVWKRYQCMSCGRWSKSEKPIAAVPKV